MGRKRTAAAGSRPDHDVYDRVERRLKAVCEIARLVKAAEGLPPWSKAKAWALDRAEAMLAALKATPL